MGYGLISFLSVLGGFILGFAGTLGHDYIKERKERKKLVELLKIEVQDIIKEIDTLECGRNYCVHPVKTPIWDGVISTGKLLLLGVFDGNLLNFYALVKDFNEWHRMRPYIFFPMHSAANKNEIEEIENAIEGALHDIKNEIHKYANSLIDKLK